MKNNTFVIFLLIIFGLYGLINYYLIKRGWQAFKDKPKLQLIYFIVLFLFSLAYPLARLLPARSFGPVRPFLLLGGSFYLGFMFYFWLLILISDLFRLGSIFLPFRNHPIKLWLSPNSNLYRLNFSFLLGLTLLVVFFGHLNSLYPRIRFLEIKVNKELPVKPPLKIAVISDLHLGSVVRLARLEKLVKLVNDLEPDLIFLVGDMIDEAISPAQTKKAATYFLKLKAHFGVYACPGNHETYNRREKCLEEITEGYIRVLADEKIVVNQGLTIIGRRDRAIESRGVKRKRIDEILGNDESQGLLILLDHQPIDLEEAEKAGVDLQLSGHTHAGQLFPLNLINRCLYEQYWGYYRRGQTHYYVSCGVGTWGPPLQTAARPEIVFLLIKPM